MRAVATVAAVAVAAVAAAAAGISGTGRLAPATQQPCAPQNSHSPSVGRFLRVDPQAALGKSSLSQNDRRRIKKDSTLCTYVPFGQIKFVVDPEVTCWMDPDSRVRVYPPTKKGNKDVIVRFEDGNSTWCNTATATEDSKFDANTGKVRLIMRDPLFGVGVDSERTVTVKVDHGYVEVSRLAGTGAVIVGPGQQVEVPNGGTPAAVTPIVLTAQDNTRIGDLSPLVPPPDYSRPDATNSPGLEAIFQRGVLRVAYQRDADAATATFVRAFFNFLARSWKLKLSLTASTSSGISNGLRVGGPYDFAVVQDANLVGSLPNIPLLADPAGVSWYVLHLVDPILDQALVAFVTADVASGDFGDLYRAAYPGTEPDYTVLRPILVSG